MSYFDQYRNKRPRPSTRIEAEPRTRQRTEGAITINIGDIGSMAPIGRNEREEKISKYVDDTLFPKLLNSLSRNDRIPVRAITYDWITNHVVIPDMPRWREKELEKHGHFERRNRELYLSSSLLRKLKLALAKRWWGDRRLKKDWWPNYRDRGYHGRGPYGGSHSYYNR